MDVTNRKAEQNECLSAFVQAGRVLSLVGMT